MKILKPLTVMACLLLAGLVYVPDAEAEMSHMGKTETVTFAGGCFWCIEAVMQQIDGVKSVISGYTGGETENPTYEEVCSGRTGHAEAVQVEFDPSVVRFEQLLDVFWQAHDPTQLNRQGADVGTQYRSAVFYHSDAQKKAVQESIRNLEASGEVKGKVVTEVAPAAKFYQAESYHQNYYRENKNASYCRFVILPKMRKLGLE